MPKIDYQKYLLSDRWRRIRRRRLHLAGDRCEWVDPSGKRCEVGTGLEVHHRHYANLGNEKDEDLKVYCRHHHCVYHAIGYVTEVLFDLCQDIEIVRRAAHAFLTRFDMDGIVKNLDYDIKKIKMAISSELPYIFRNWIERQKG